MLRDSSGAERLLKKGSTPCRYVLHALSILCSLICVYFGGSGEYNIDEGKSNEGYYLVECYALYKFTYVSDEPTVSVFKAEE
jgi:hypothetical protein